MSTASTGIYGLGIVLVQAQEQGILRRLSFIPQPAWTFVCGHMLASGTLVFIAAGLLLLTGYTVFQVPLPHHPVQ